jgi:hypothetical protein
MKQEELRQFLISKPGYLKKSAEYLANKSNLSVSTTKLILRDLKQKKVSKKALKKLVEPKKEKVLLYDIETSYNVVWTWSLGSRVFLGPDNIIKERQIICICYKWLGDSKVHSIEWNKGDDKELCIKFSKILAQADVTIGHNADNFDSKFFMGRCLYHGIPVKFEAKKVDTLKIARKLFRLNSNKLDYLGKYLGFGGKRDTGGIKTWIDIIFNNNRTALNKMVFYCKGDVLLLEKIYNKLIKHIPEKKK